MMGRAGIGLDGREDGGFWSWTRKEVLLFLSLLLCLCAFTSDNSQTLLLSAIHSFTLSFSSISSTLASHRAGDGPFTH